MRMLPWVLTAQLATSAIAVVVGGPIIDAIGVRRTFRVAGIWFVLSTAAAAAAPSMPLLVGARAVQGFGGGLVFAVVFATIGLAYPHELRARAFATQSVIFGITGFGGPAFAGVMLAFGGWRTIFVVQLPLCRDCARRGLDHTADDTRAPVADTDRLDRHGASDAGDRLLACGSGPDRCALVGLRSSTDRNRDIYRVVLESQRPGRPPCTQSRTPHSIPARVDSSHIRSGDVQRIGGG